jgi:hypothetical protein
VVGDPAPRVPAGCDGAECGVVKRGIADLGLLGQEITGLTEERYLGVSRGRSVHGCLVVGDLADEGAAGESGARLSGEAGDHAGSMGVN